MSRDFQPRANTAPCRTQNFAPTCEISTLPSKPAVALTPLRAPISGASPKTAARTPVAKPRQFRAPSTFCTRQRKTTRNTSDPGRQPYRRARIRSWSTTSTPSSTKACFARSSRSCFPTALGFICALRNRIARTQSAFLVHGLLTRSKRSNSRWTFARCRMPAYESNSFRPPAPVALVSVRLPETGDAPNANGVPLLSPGSLRAPRGAHPGNIQTAVGYSERVTQPPPPPSCNAFGVRHYALPSVPRVALLCRLPWALECYRFAVRARLSSFFSLQQTETGIQFTISPWMKPT